MTKSYDRVLIDAYETCNTESICATVINLITYRMQIDPSLTIQTLEQDFRRLNLDVYLVAIPQERRGAGTEGFACIDPVTEEPKPYFLRVELVPRHILESETLHELGISYEENVGRLADTGFLTSPVKPYYPVLSQALATRDLVYITKALATILKLRDQALAPHLTLADLERDLRHLGAFQYLIARPYAQRPPAAKSFIAVQVPTGEPAPYFLWIAGKGREDAEYAFHNLGVTYEENLERLKTTGFLTKPDDFDA